MLKISFLGDIMCESPFLNAAKQQDGEYDFSTAFEDMQAICSNSDCVIGNLETPLAGEAKSYTHEMYSFNTPDSFAQAVKNMGVSFVLTANNHCCDRGIEGLQRTLMVLDQCNLPHTGTYQNKTEDMTAYINVNDVRIAIISCTSSTNANRNKCKPSVDYVNLLQEQFVKPRIHGKRELIRIIKRFIVKRIIGEENHIRLRKLRGLPPKKPSIDNSLNINEISPYIETICQQVLEAKKKADLVFVCPHMGGQFNVVPGKFSEYIMSRLTEIGADAVIASHPHIVQKAEMKNGVPCFFSLGNVSMSMSTLYILRDELPDYGIMVHFYVEDKKIKKVTFSVIKMEENDCGYLSVEPVFDLYPKVSLDDRRILLENTQEIVRRVIQNPTFIIKDILEEFTLYEIKNEE